MDISKTFVLIVGNGTNTVTKGSCKYCYNYNSNYMNCNNGHSVDYRSYIKYECEKAVEAGITIIVLYKSTYIDKSKCPDILRNKGKHKQMLCKGIDGNIYWDYNAVKEAFE